MQILNGTCINGEEGYRRIESIGWKRLDELRVYVFRREVDSTALDYLIDRKLEQLGAGFTLHFGNRLLFVLNNSLTLIPQFETELQELLIKIDSCCGRSPRFCDIFDLNQHFEMAVIAADFSSGPGRIREIESAAIPYYYSLIAKNDKAQISHPALNILRQYDQDHGTQMYLTLKIYLQCERNYIKTAEELHLHRNSLIYRTRRIEELTGVDFESFAIRQYILMSYEIENIRVSQTGLQTS